MTQSRVVDMNSSKQIYQKTNKKGKYGLAQHSCSNEHFMDSVFWKLCSEQCVKTSLMGHPFLRYDYACF